MKKILAILLSLVFLQGAYAADFLSADDSRVTDALNYLSSVQEDNGGFGDQPSTCWTVSAIASAGDDPSTYTKGENTPISYLQAATITEPLNPPNAYSRTILALVAAGEDPTSFNSENLVATLKSYDSDLDGNFGNIQANVWALLALTSAGETSASQRTADYILSTENAQGCWGTESNTCAAAIQALKAAGVSNDQLSNAKAKLKEYQLADGGFMECATCPGGEVSDANSDAWALQAIVALGESVDSWAVDGNDPLTHLLSLQQAGGSFSWSPTEDKNVVMNTYQAIPAMLGKPNPISTIHPDLTSEVQFFASSDESKITMKAVKNAGNIGATDAKLTVTIDKGTPTELTQTISALSDFAFEADLSEGTHTYTVSVDPDGDYTETDETNNEASGTISTTTATAIISKDLGNEVLVEHRDRVIPENAKAYEIFAGIRDTVTYTDWGWGISIDSVDGIFNTWDTPYSYWAFFHNGFSSAVGVHDTVSTGDELQLDYYTHSWGALDLYWDITVVYPAGDTSLQEKAEAMQSTIEAAGITANTKADDALTEDEKSNWLVLLGAPGDNAALEELKAGYGLDPDLSTSANQGIIHQIRNPRTNHIAYVTIVSGNDEFGLSAAADKIISESSAIQAYPTTYVDAINLVSSISASNTNPTNGDTVNFEINVANQGSIDAEDVTLAFFIGDTEQFTKTLSVPQKSQVQETFSWTSSTGTHTARTELASSIQEAETTDNNDTLSITVNSPPSNNGGSPSYGGGTIASSSSQTKTVSKIAKGASETLEFDKPSAGVTELKIKAKETLEDVKITASSTTYRPKKLTETEPEGKVHKYITIKHELEEEALESVDVSFRVKKTWLEDNDIDPKDVVLARYEDGEWTQLKTTQIREDSKYITFKAVSPGLSVYAVKTYVKEEEPEEEGAEKAPPEGQKGAEQEAESSGELSEEASGEFGESGDTTLGESEGEAGGTGGPAGMATAASDAQNPGIFSRITSLFRRLFDIFR